jgi:rubrerythrin
MSYLGLPRLHFFGKFQADPSTINNNPASYDNDAFQPRFQREEPPVAPFSSWNPMGSGAFRLDKCVITGVIGRGDDTVATTERTDPLVGGRLADDNQKVSAKLVDLDPYQQASSEIFGLRLRLFDNAGRPVLSGDFETASFFDFWLRFPQATTTLQGAAIYQSIIDNVEFYDTESRIAAELKAGSSDGKLSIKFNVDGYDINSSSETFTWGRIVGSIGCYHEGEPRHLVAGRRLRQQVGGPLQHAACHLDIRDKKLHIDLGNSIPTTSVGGSLQALGQLQVMLLPDREVPIPLASIDDIDDDFYRTQAGVVSLPLSDSQVRSAASSRIAIAAAGRGVFLAENVDGIWVQADRSVFRIYPGGSSAGSEGISETTFYATRFGKPAEDVDIAVWHLEQVPPVPATAVADLPVDRTAGTEGESMAQRVPVTSASEPVLIFDSRVRTDSSGRAALRLTARDPGHPRPHIDGQVYTVFYSWGQGGAREQGQLSVLVWSHYPVPEKVDWITDIQPIFQQYANLYPVMRNILDLSNYHHVVRYRDRLRKSVSEPIKSPSHMPVTRDLSPGKRAAFIKWLSTEPTPPVLRIGDRADLLRMLQVALQIEHATIPAYLSALFSIKLGRNAEVARIIRGVVLQEMLHMALVGNIINAVGGKPQIDRPGFVPRYPSHLPGGVLPDLVVSLRKCSTSHVRDVFVAIEQPDVPINTDALELLSPIRPERLSLTADGHFLRYESDNGEEAGAERFDEFSERIRKFFVAAEYEKFTIGWFYQQIASAMCDLEAKEQQHGKTLFVGDSARQVAWPSAPGHLFRVTDLRSALWSILEIIYQGEGTPGEPTTGTGTRQELAHYYRFQEIVKGRQLIKKDGKWVFEGPSIPFDPDGVYPMIDDPDTSALPPQSRVREASLLCDRVYSDLLTALDRVFDGHPETLDSSVSLMFSLQVQAKNLLTMPTSPGADTVAGPSFQV